jgi:hypothetical protein
MNPDTGHAHMIAPGMHAGVSIPIPAQWDECAKALIAIGTPLWHPSHPFDELRRWAIANLSPEGKATMDAYMAERTTTVAARSDVRIFKKSGKQPLSREAKKRLKDKRKAEKLARKKSRR